MFKEIFWLSKLVVRFTHFKFGEIENLKFEVRHLN
jgi:hypothetical protein